MNDAETRRVCAHEAGHVAAAHLLGREYGAAVYERGGVAGTNVSEPEAFTFYAEEPLRATYRAKPVDSLLDDMVVFASGAVAERLVERTQYGTAAPVVTGPDGQAVEAAGLAMAQKYPSNEVAQSFKAMAFWCAWRLLADHVPAIRAIADALLRERKLSAAEVASIFAATENAQTEEPPKA